MKNDTDPPGKRDRLKQAGTLNSTPENIRDPRFTRGGDFFDARDLLQVRYEMVRLVRFEQVTLAEAARRFGVSRPTCFRLSRAFGRGGLEALIPAPRGPRGPHKITADILDFVADYRRRHGYRSARRLVPLIEKKFGVKLHPRGLEKALVRGRQKKTPGAGT
ncbi:MAG: helix-turn-helix domain-containing protein [Rhodobacteraceae bacterium]|nr:helix-turn-helix domain-containing protein [Paracoccaceae bacterium]